MNSSTLTAIEAAKSVVRRIEEDNDARPEVTSVDVDTPGNDNYSHRTFFVRVHYYQTRSGKPGPKAGRSVHMQITVSVKDSYLGETAWDPVDARIVREALPAVEGEGRHFVFQDGIPLIVSKDTVRTTADLSPASVGKILKCL